MSEEEEKKVTNFLNEIEKLCRKYNFSIGHEDSHGAFIITKYDQYYIDWLRSAYIEME